MVGPWPQMDPVLLGMCDFRTIIETYKKATVLLHNIEVDRGFSSVQN